jgi:hypothetical protein
MKGGAGMQDQVEPAALATLVAANGQAWLTPEREFDLRNRFRREGFVKLREIALPEVREAVAGEVFRLLDQHAERRDLLLATTGGTPRFMSVVRSEVIAEHSPVINGLYRSGALASLLARIAGEPLHACPSRDEEFLITRQERANDTHGWHWGDFSFALIWIIAAPPLEAGGMLQCVPHTRWDKQAPRINEYLCANPIATYGFSSGDLYFLRTDTTLHRTVPLTRDATRVILNMTWAADADLRRAVTGADRWWEDSDVDAARQVES